MATYAITRHPSGARTITTEDPVLYRRIIQALGDDGLMGAGTTDDDGTPAWQVTYRAEAHEALEAQLVTWGAVESHWEDDLIGVDINGNALPDTGPLDVIYPNGSRLRIPVALYEVESCRTCRTNIRMSLGASIAGLAASLIALVAVLVALQ